MKKFFKSKFIEVGDCLIDPREVVAITGNDGNLSSKPYQCILKNGVKLFLNREARDIIVEKLI